jgi:hypothetical protein
MSDPLRLAVLKKLTALIETVTTANGYLYNLNGCVFRGRTTFGETDPIPLISLLEGESPEPTNLAGANNNQRERMWSIILQGWVENDHANPSDNAYLLAAEVERALGQVTAVNRQGDAAVPDWYLLGGTLRVTRFVIGAPVVRPPSEGIEKHATFYMPLLIGLAEKAGEPYSNV